MDGYKKYSHLSESKIKEMDIADLRQMYKDLTGMEAMFGITDAQLLSMVLKEFRKHRDRARAMMMLEKDFPSFSNGGPNNGGPDY